MLSLRLELLPFAPDFFSYRCIYNYNLNYKHRNFF